MNWGHFLFGFSDRLNRAKYWLWVLLYLIVTIIVTAIIYFINSPLAGGIVQLAFSIVAIVSSLAVMTKRLHDRNKSAWWLLIYVLIPSILLGVGVGTTVYGAMSSGGSDLGTVGLIGTIFSLLAAAIFVWVFVDLGCLRGTVGPNQYGPDPLEGKI